MIPEGGKGRGGTEEKRVKGPWIISWKCAILFHDGSEIGYHRAGLV